MTSCNCATTERKYSMAKGQNAFEAMMGNLNTKFNDLNEDSPKENNSNKKQEKKINQPKQPKVNPTPKNSSSSSLEVTPGKDNIKSIPGKGSDVEVFTTRMAKIDYTAIKLYAQAHNISVNSLIVTALDQYFFDKSDYPEFKKVAATLSKIG